MPIVGWTAYQATKDWLEAQKASQARVIVDPRDATRDFYLPHSTANAAHRAGLLAFDATNNTYTTKR